jgi:GNAT superfamily N-acetyltransferase
MLPHLLDQAHHRNRILLARAEDRIVGFGMMVWAIDTDSKVVWGEIEVSAEWRGRGIGTRLLDEIESFTREQGRTIVQGGVYHRSVDGPRLESPTGFGSLPRDEQAVRFLLGHGYSLEQVYRYSTLTLPVDRAVIDPLYDAAVAKAGPDYRVVTWTHRVPEQWLDSIATIFMRMATDAPAGNLEIDEEVWDADRVRKNDDKRLASGRVQLAAAVEHVPSGTLVAFNGVSLAEDRTRPVHQGITLVLKEHRGNRLGTIVKIANIRQLESFNPAAPFILTDNAEENRPMLDVNEAVGFKATAYEGVWKKILT